MYQNQHDTICPTLRRRLTAIGALCAIAGVLAWSALPDPAVAGERADSAFTRSERITVRQGDLDNPVAASRLFDRIEETALEVCGASPFSFPDVRRAVRRSDCWRQGVSTAVAALHDARLAQRLDTERGSIAWQD
jgi:UrcA family protein